MLALTLTLFCCVAPTPLPWATLHFVVTTSNASGRSLRQGDRIDDVTGARFTAVVE